MVTIVMAEVFGCTCDKCGYEWKSFEQPKRCAWCKTTAWNRNGASQAKTPLHNNDVVRTDPPAEIVAPIAKERPVARERKPWKEVKVPAGKKKLCPHGFAIVSGVTACARCN